MAYSADNFNLIVTAIDIVETLGYLGSSRGISHCSAAVQHHVPDRGLDYMAAKQV